MADEPDNVTLRLLREIRAAQQEHSVLLREHATELKELRKQIADWQETTATAAGFAMHGNVRLETANKRIDDLTKRVERLEEQL